MPVTVFTDALTSGDVSGWGGFSIRNLCTTSGATGTKVRITVKAPASGTFKCDHVGIGKQSTTYNTAATPVELLFSGGSGFTLASGGGTLTSDFANMNVASGDVLIVIFDNSAAGGGTIPSDSSAPGSSYDLAATASYNAASPAGSWTLRATHDDGVNTIEISGFTLTCAFGSFVLTGEAVTFKKTLHLVCAVGTFALTGFSATLSKGYHFTMATGSFALTGFAAVLTHLSNSSLLRGARFVLQKLRQSDAKLDD